MDYSVLGIPLPIPDARYFLSGGICAAASHGVTVPLDVVKTRIQADPDQFSGGLWDSCRRLIQQEGPETLLSGLAPTVVGYGMEGAAKFGLYESLKPIFASIITVGNHELTIPYLAASVVAGASASLMLCPLEQTRIRLVTDPSFSEEGLVSGLTRLIQQEGPGSVIFGGLPAMLSKQVPYTIGKQLSFDFIAGMLYTLAASLSLGVTDVHVEVSVAAAFCASIVACLLSHPGDVVLTATFKVGKGGEGTQTELPAFTAVVSQVFNEQGLNGFFAGLTARFFHVGAIITSQLVLYDFVKQLLGLPATGAS
jgi:solute carrier family 25 phosphate transporter 3